MCRDLSLLVEFSVPQHVQMLFCALKRNQGKGDMTILQRRDMASTAKHPYTEIIYQKQKFGAREDQEKCRGTPSPPLPPHQTQTHFNSEWLWVSSFEIEINLLRPSYISLHLGQTHKLLIFYVTGINLYGLLVLTFFCFQEHLWNIFPCNGTFLKHQFWWLW